MDAWGWADIHGVGMHGYGGLGWRHVELGWMDTWGWDGWIHGVGWTNMGLDGHKWGWEGHSWG